jgi:hypothetical protein
MKTGRNDPCPCGSGKKYKHCCLLGETSAKPVESPALSAQRKALEYLDARFHTQQTDIITDDFFLLFDDEDELRDALAELDPAYHGMLQVNINDWLLCEGEYERRGEWKRGIELVLADKQLRLADVERAYLQALAQAPLHLREITAIERGRGFCLRDLHVIGAPALFVHEVAATRGVSDGDVIGVRLVEDPDRTLRMGGGLYPLARTAALEILEDIRLAEVGDDIESPPLEPTQLDDGQVASMIRDEWLANLLEPPELPHIVTRSGEPMMLIDDEYEVLDLAALQAALDAENDVQGDGENGWVRLLPTGAGDSRQVLTAINPAETAGRIVLFHRSPSLAEQGREWFGRIAGNAVRHHERRVIDPAELLAKPQADGSPLRPPGPEDIRPEDIGPEEHVALISSVIHATYADWCDAPLPLFNDVSPRAMLATREGRERVRFLLRTYELSEQQMAADQDRPAVSYEFLWDRLGLARTELPENGSG